MNRETFFAYVRKAPFGGRLTEQQVDGLNKILDHWEGTYPKEDERFLAYILATIAHETAFSMQPVEEGYPMRGSKLKAYQKGLRYYPWYGRGLVQITWEDNYKKFGITRPEDALEWHVSLWVTFSGMFGGMFTGKALKDYFDGDKEDARGARAIVNGTDKAGLIADYYTAFKGAIVASKAPEQPKDVVPEAAKPDHTPITKDAPFMTFLTTVLTSAVAAMVSAVKDGYGLAALAMILVILGGSVGSYVYFRAKRRYQSGV